MVPLGIRFLSCLYIMAKIVIPLALNFICVRFCFCALHLFYKHIHICDYSLLSKKHIIHIAGSSYIRGMYLSVRSQLADSDSDSAPLLLFASMRVRYFEMNRTRYLDVHIKLAALSYANIHYWHSFIVNVNFLVVGRNALFSFAMVWVKHWLTCLWTLGRHLDVWLSTKSSRTNRT